MITAADALSLSLSRQPLHRYSRYTAAVYNVFNVMDRQSETSTERVFAVFGYVVLIMIDGAVAGVMSALMITMGE
eukprot:COSAG01_NODE_752_length_13837_cov_76.381670_21_plen_75_part_00